MTTDTLDCKVITPESVLYNGQAAMVEAPGILGDFGVLPGHANFVSALRPGIISIHETSEKILRIFVGGGIAEISEQGCALLAEHVIDVQGLSRADAEKRLESAHKALEHAFDTQARLKAEREVDIAEALLQAVA